MPDETIHLEPPPTRPTPGWSEPDRYGRVSFIVHDTCCRVTEPPTKEGWVCKWVACFSGSYVRFTYIKEASDG